MKKSLAEIRAETPSSGRIVHLNNAGTSLSPLPVTNTVLQYLELEQSMGGYEAESHCAQQLDAVYSSLAKLLGCQASEVAITQNATRSWDMIFYALKLGPGDKILTCRSEYASNFISFLQRCRQTGAAIEVVKNDSSGCISLDALKNALTPDVKVVAINHIPTNGGLVQPAEKIGEILKKHPAFYLLDACQSVGQVPVNVKKIGCDALTATSRKYLRGPRGVGFLYVSDKKLRDLEPPFLDLHSATWTAENKFKIRMDARRFETYEIFVAGKLGLGAAAEYALKVGVKEGWKRLKALAKHARQELKTIRGVEVHDLGKTKGGIVTFTVRGWTAGNLREELFKRKINIWTCTVRSARLDMAARQLDEVARASFHYYNTEEEVAYFTSQVRELAKQPVCS